MEFMNYLQKLPPFSNQNFLNEINLDPPQYLPSITDTVLKILDSENSSYCSANENQLQSPPIYRNFRPPPPPYRPATEKPPPPPYKITQSWIDNCNNFKQYIPGDQEIDIYNDDWASEIQNSDFFSSETESDFYGSRSETPSPHVTAKRSDFVQELFPPSKRRCFSPEDSGWNSENSTTKQLPRDLVEWKEEHVSLWLKWFLRSFYDHKPNLSRIPNNGVELDKLNLADLINITGDWKVANMLWDDLIPYKKETFEYEGEISNENESSRLSPEHKNTIKDRILQTFVAEKKNAKNDNTGQFQLWQFLLDLLSKREHSDKIEWEGEDGTFKLKLPDEVAKMWGKKKKKEGMTYEKLSRSLRYYYDKQIMSKVNGKRFSYKFDLDGLTRAYHPTGVSDSCFIQADDLNCPPRNFPLTSYMQRDIQKSVSPSSSI